MMLIRFQSSFELTGYITVVKHSVKAIGIMAFQSSFELTGYITESYKSKHCRWSFSFKALSSLRVI